jgi:hypothetical protein
MPGLHLASIAAPEWPSLVVKALLRKKWQKPVPFLVLAALTGVPEQTAMDADAPSGDTTLRAATDCFNRVPYSLPLLFH